MIITNAERSDTIPRLLPFSVPMGFRIMMAASDEFEYLRLQVQMRPVESNAAWLTVFDHNPAVPFEHNTEINAAVESPENLDLPVGSTSWRILLTARSTEGTPVVYEQIVGLGTTEITDRAGNRRSHVEKMIRLLETTIENRLTNRGDIETYTIAGRRVKTVSLDELKTTLAKYREEQSRLRNPRQIWYRHR